MNLRQKAKHYKRLYEQFGNCRINPIIVKTVDLQPYKVSVCSTFPVQLEREQVCHTVAEMLTDKMIPLVDSLMDITFSDSGTSYADVKATFNFWCVKDSVKS